MGKLNIAHHKSYHPYRRDNIERVRRDEEEARLKETQAEGKMLLADAEARMDLLRSRASNAPSKRQIEKEEEKLIVQRTSAAELKTGHINLFEDLEQQSLITSSKITNAKKSSEETDKGIPLAPSARDLKPWYSVKGKERISDGVDEDDGRRARDMNRKLHADPLTSINSELATSHRSSSTISNHWRPRRPPPAPADEPDKSTSGRKARLTRESAERQRALELIRRKKRGMEGSETPGTMRGGGYGDMYNKADVEEAHKHRDKAGGRRRW